MSPPDAIDETLYVVLAFCHSTSCFFDLTPTRMHARKIKASAVRNDIPSSRPICL